jgi:hypothetical protein
MVLELINQGIGYVRQGFEIVRNLLTKVVGFLPWDEQLSLTVLFLAASFFAGHFIVKRFVTKPFQLPYCIWLIVISISIFLNLMFL